MDFIIYSTEGVAEDRISRVEATTRWISMAERRARLVVPELVQFVDAVQRGLIIARAESHRTKAGSDGGRVVEVSRAAHKEGIAIGMLFRVGRPVPTEVVADRRWKPFDLKHRSWQRRSSRFRQE